MIFNLLLGRKMKKQKLRFYKKWAFSFFIGIFVGIAINYYFDVGYNLEDFFEFTMQTIVQLLTSWACITFVLVLLLLKPIKELLKNVCGGVKPAFEAYASNLANKQKDQQLAQQSPTFPIMESIGANPKPKGRKNAKQ